MLELIVSYIAGIGPYFAIALVLGMGIPLLLLVKRPARWLVVTAVLFLCLSPLGGENITGASEGSLYRQVGWGLAFLVALFYTIRGQNRFIISWNFIPMSYLILLIYALISVAWSDTPFVSAKRVVQLFGVLFIALALIRHSQEGDAFNLFAWPGLFFLLLGVLSIAIPTLSFGEDGNYKGFASTKNVWGQFALLMALVYIFLAIGKYRPRLNWWLFAFATASLFATRSATTIGIYVAAIIIVMFWLASKRYGSKMHIAALAFALISATSIFGYFLLYGSLPFDDILQASLGAAGKDITLTGRTALWEMMGYEIARHPWIGTGFGGFWLGLEGQSITIVRYFSWRPGQAHNGYIDVVNELGYVGLALLLIVLVAHLRTIYLLNCHGYGLKAVFHLTILVSALLLNASETNFMRTTHLWWIILTTSIISAHLCLRQQTEATEPSIAAGKPGAQLHP